MLVDAVNVDEELLQLVHDQARPVGYLLRIGRLRRREEEEENHQAAKEEEVEGGEVICCCGVVNHCGGGFEGLCCELRRLVMGWVSSSLSRS